MRRPYIYLLATFCTLTHWRRLWHAAHPELLAANDRLHDGREPVVAAHRPVHDAPDGRHVVVLQFTPGRIRQQAFGERLNELLGTTEDRRAQVVGTLDWRAIRQHA